MKNVIEMAREAGFPFNKYGLLAADENGEIDVDEMLKRFADLVREDMKREVITLCNNWDFNVQGLIRQIEGLK